MSWYQAGAAVDFGPNSNVENSNPIVSTVTDAGFVWGGTSGRQTVRIFSQSRPELQPRLVLWRRVRVWLEEVEVRSLVAMLSMGLAACSKAAVAPPPAAAASQTAPAATPSRPAVAPESRTYLVLLQEDGQTWCVYKNPTDFQAEVEEVKPTDRARVTFAAGKLAERTYQIEAESGDLIVVAKYTPKDDGAVLRRVSLLAQENRQVIQEADIRGGKADPFHMVSVSTLDGKKAEPSPTADLPEVPVSTNLMVIPAVQIAIQLRS